MKNIFKKMGDGLHRKCDSLSQSQRKKLLILLFVSYLFFTAVVIISGFMADANHREEEHFNNLIDSDIQRDSLMMPILTIEDTEPLNYKDYE